MSIRAKVRSSFLVILILFGVNILVFFRTNQMKTNSLTELGRAVECQVLVASATRSLSDLQRQVALLGQMSEVTEDFQMSAEETLALDEQLSAIEAKLDSIGLLVTDSQAPFVDEIEANFKKLASSWRIFYGSFGRDHTVALMELALRAEPLGQQVVQGDLPRLAQGQRRRVDAARSDFFRISILTERFTLFMFGVSSLLAIGVAFLFSRYLGSSLAELKLGAEMIGFGRLEHKIVIKNQDEFGSLARSFNDMASELHKTREGLTRANQELKSEHRQVVEQRKRSQDLLLNILPTTIAEELESRGEVTPRYFENVTVLFTDFRGFTASTENIAADDLVHLLHEYFTAFDEISSRYGLEKLKTIGDSYMCVRGLPNRIPSHSVDVVLAAMEMLQAVETLGKLHGAASWQVRVGINTGPVIAGVVGIHKFAYDIWGETVNLASRMESSGAPGRINVSEQTHSRIKDFFVCEQRGMVDTKERQVPMYFVNGILPTLLDGSNSGLPPAFLKRYLVYFQKDPPAFPTLTADPG